MNAARQSPERWSPARTKPRAPVGARLQSRDLGKLFFPPFYLHREHPNNSFSPCSIHDRKCLQKQQAKRINNGNKMRSSGSPHHREESRPIAQGSCQSELHRALERLAASQTRTHEDLYVIPIPNCDRNGNFHPKQCHPALDGQRGKCWCVDRKTGVKLPGFLELKGDLDCHQPADSM